MDLTLKRDSCTKEGVFGIMGDFQTLEHAYPGDTGSWVAKVLPGAYVCVLGAHRLEGMDHDFQTYEVTGVKGHSGILFHKGNWNKDSNGCILLGMKRSGDGLMLFNSKDAFDKFMSMQEGIGSFQLTVI